MLDAVVQIHAGADANDDIRCQFYDLGASAAVGGSEQANDSLPASGYGQLVLHCLYYTASATTVQVWAVNNTAARGSVTPPITTNVVITGAGSSSVNGLYINQGVNPNSGYGGNWWLKTTNDFNLVFLAGSAVRWYVAEANNGTAAAGYYHSAQSVSSTDPVYGWTESGIGSAGADGGTTPLPSLAYAYGAPATNMTALALSSSSTKACVPAITALSVSTGESVSLTITGAGLTGATAVKINGTSCTSVVVVSDTEITCTTPASFTTGAVAVTTPGGVASYGSFTP
jgi:hypothetical protein